MDNNNKTRIVELAKKGGNKRCFDCNILESQWASITLGTFFCLECSGQHRSLGVQLSFVRSVGMDKWMDAQIKRMEKSGNDFARAFLEKRGFDFSKSIPEKYRKGGPADELREYLAAICPITPQDSEIISAKKYHLNNEKIPITTTNQVSSNNRASSNDIVDRITSKWSDIYNAIGITTKRASQVFENQSISKIIDTISNNNSNESQIEHRSRKLQSNSISTEEDDKWDDW